MKKIGSGITNLLLLFAMIFVTAIVGGWFQPNEERIESVVGYDIPNSAMSSNEVAQIADSTLSGGFIVLVVFGVAILFSIFLGLFVKTIDNSPQEREQRTMSKKVWQEYENGLKNIQADARAPDRSKVQNDWLG